MKPQSIEERSDLEAYYLEQPSISVKARLKSYFSIGMPLRLKLKPHSSSYCMAISLRNTAPL